MKFTLHDSSFNSKTESDWETAIDLVTATIDVEYILLRAEGGAVVAFHRESISTSGKYLEPDFSGENGGVGPYVYHDDHSASASDVTCNDCYAAVRNGIEPISVEEFKTFFEVQSVGGNVYEKCPNEAVKVIKFQCRDRTYISNGIEPISAKEFETFFEDEYCRHFTDRDEDCTDEHFKVIKFQCQSRSNFTARNIEEDVNTPPEYSSFYFLHTGIDSKMVKQIFKNMPSNLGCKGGALEFEIDLPADVEKNLREIGTRQAADEAAMPQLIIENMAREANAKVRIAIDQMALTHLYEMGEGKKMSALAG